MTLNMLPAQSIPLPVLTEALHSDAFYVRYAAAQKLAERADRDARLLADALLKDESAPTRASVARSLHAFSWYSAEPLFRVALADADHRVREAAVYALCALNDLAGFQLLAQQLLAETDEVRMAAAWGLRDCQDVAALPCLEAILRADDPEVRVKGLEALGGSELDEALPIVRQMMNDRDPAVIYAATLSLIELAGDSCFEELSAVITRTKGAALQEIMRGFFHATNYLKIEVGTAKSINTLIDALENALWDESAAARLAAIWPLAWIRHPRVSGVIREAFRREPDSAAKIQMLRVTFALAATVADELLAEAIRSADVGLRAVAEKIERVSAPQVSG